MLTLLGRRFGLLLAAVLIILFSLELALRAYGFGKPLLYEATPYGYRVKPDQHLQRFGNRLDYNREGMRSSEISARPTQGVLRVLCIGDSITFGGVQTPQSETYPAQIEQALYRAGRQAEVLNASAGGWALGNEWGWLQERGIFASDVVIFEVGLNDLFQMTSPPAVVDGHPSFPSRNPRFALQEAVMRYVLPRLGMVDITDPGARPGASPNDLLQGNLITLKHMVEFARERGGTVYVLSIEEPLFSGGSMPEMAAAYMRLEALLADLKVDLIRPMRALREDEVHVIFRDGVHPTSVGNGLIGNVVARNIYHGAK